MFLMASILRYMLYPFSALPSSAHVLIQAEVMSPKDGRGSSLSNSACMNDLARNSAQSIGSSRQDRSGNTEQRQSFYPPCSRTIKSRMMHAIMARNRTPAEPQQTSTQANPPSDSGRRQMGEQSNKMRRTKQAFRPCLTLPARRLHQNGIP